MRISDERMLEALASTTGITKASEMLGCNRKTIYDRLKKPAFYAKLQQQRKDSLILTASKVAGAQELAVETLIDIMHSESATVGCKLKASEIVLNTCLKISQQLDIINELHEIKQMMKM